nr:MAG TPA: hypothetical protein [Caudoviricetes sp.]
MIMLKVIPILVFQQCLNLNEKRRIFTIENELRKEQ